MPINIQIQVLPEKVENLDFLKGLAATKLGIQKYDIQHFRIRKKSIDARRKPVKYQVSVDVFQGDEEFTPLLKTPIFHQVNDRPSVHIIGAGPAGMFAALQCLELNLKPIILERGKPVRERRRDLAKLNKEHKVNPESNYCFGEGGAGTYSDGKLYTRSTKRGDVRKVLSLLVHHGAEEDIMVNAHPHIGTNKLPGIIEEIRETILAHGGEIRFEEKLIDLELHGKIIKTITSINSTQESVNQIIICTGHSARDIFKLLKKNNLRIENKTFALGVRIEHPQPLINTIQYHGESTPEYLPPASYSLVHQADGLGVYSFCMCPGGIIAPCATDEGEVVSNGWSPSKRNNPYANSGIVVEVPEKCLEPFSEFGELRGVKFQEHVEKTCWEAAGKTQKLPAQRLVDFLEGRLSETLPKTSYIPGVESVRLDLVLPKEISSRLQKGFRAFGKKMKGYLTNEAVLVAPESRTSSPVRIPRNELMQHPQASNLYPVGEGAGYAGGIMSAAIDGMKAVQMIAEKISD